MVNKLGVFFIENILSIDKKENSKKYRDHAALTLYAVDYYFCLTAISNNILTTLLSNVSKCSMKILKLTCRESFPGVYYFLLFLAYAQIFSPYFPFCNVGRSATHPHPTTTVLQQLLPLVAFSESYPIADPTPKTPAELEVEAFFEEQLLPITVATTDLTGKEQGLENDRMLWWRQNAILC